MNDNNQKFFPELKEYRKSKNISIEDIVQNTKINIKYIKAIEEGDFNLLPNAYRKLFLKTYSNYIGFNTKKALSEYESHNKKKYGKIITNKTPEYISNKNGMKSITNNHNKSILKESYFIIE